jgi:hypothetical protein
MFIALSKINTLRRSEDGIHVAVHATIHSAPPNGGVGR